MKNNYRVDGNEIIIRVNKNIYPKEVIIQTTYVMLEDFYFLIDEDDSNYVVYMKQKKDSNLKGSFEDFVYSFFDELVESQSYLDQLKRTSAIRQTILEKALLSQTLDDDE